MAGKGLSERSEGSLLTGIGNAEVLGDYTQIAACVLSKQVSRTQD